MATSATRAISSQAASTAVPLNYSDVGSAPISVLVILSNTPTLTYNVEGTLDNLMDPTVTPTWTALTGLSALSASTLIIPITYPIKGVRLNVTAYTAGTATMQVLQGSVT